MRAKVEDMKLRAEASETDMLKLKKEYEELCGKNPNFL
jgi:hypothetical protein